MRKKKKRIKGGTRKAKPAGATEGRVSRNVATHTVISAHMFFFFCIEGEAGYWEAWEGPRVGEGGLVMGFVGYVVWLLNFWGLVVTD